MTIDEQILQAKILIVDDQELDVRLLSSILKKNGYNNIISTMDSEDVLSLQEEHNPDLIILDLNMPHLDGFQIMAQLEKAKGDIYLPILILSADESQEKKFQALKSGAKDFLSKPYDRVEVLIRIHNLIESRILHNELRQEKLHLEDKVKERTYELYETQKNVIYRLARAVEYRDSDTGSHILRMSHYSARLAQEIGLSEEECEMILVASPLHDVGKIAISDNILLKPGALDAKEWGIMKAHTTTGGEILEGEDSKFLKIAREIALTHHEKWDGSGYPQGLKGEAIPMVGRICGVCDVFDALTTERPYKKAWTVEEAMEEIEKMSGSSFSPEIVKSFKKILPDIVQIKETYVDSL